MPDDHARTTADIMVETDLMGVDSHGLSMLMTYEQGVQAGASRCRRSRGCARDTGPTALLDAGNGLGHPVSALAMNMAVDKAMQHGIGVVGVVNSHHFGAAGAYARIASARGVIGMVTSSAQGITMVPTRGRHAGAGHQPAGLRRARQAQSAFRAGHGDDDGRRRQGEGAPPERRAAAAGLGGGRHRPEHHRPA